MQVNDRCVQCLLNMQRTRAEKNHNEALTEQYMEQVQKILDERDPADNPPFMVYLFDGVYRKLFGGDNGYGTVKREFNEYVLSMEAELEQKLRKGITSGEELLARAIAYARIGNYIDFAAMDTVDKEEFLSLFDNGSLSEDDMITFRKFCADCAKAEKFLLIADNCGEIVLDKVLLRVLKECYPNLSVSVLVRGQDVLNDATVEDALFVGMDQEAEIISNGSPVVGTMYERMSEEAKAALDQADVVLSKGQANFETLSDQGRHIYYAFLCKCEVFTSRFQVPRLTGMFVSDL